MSQLQSESGESEIPKLVLRRVIRAKRERVFEAWTNPELMAQWLVPPPDWTARSRNELVVGGRYHHEMIVGDNPESGCGGEYSPGQVLLHEGEYLEISPPERLVFTWNTHAVSNTRVTVEFKELGDSTELWLTHELLSTEELRQGHSAGWEGCLNKLEQLLQHN